VKGRFVIFLLFFISLALSMSGNVPVRLVYLEHSDVLAFDEQRLPDAQILRGNVCFRQDSALMYCDSAYFFDKKNSLHAFGNVHLIQGDSIEGFGDVLYYNGNTKLARFRRNVRLIHKGQSTLRTDSLNYNRARNLAYYFSGGTIEDSLNILSSRWGQYTPDDNQAVFRDDVELVNSRFTLWADTLCYNTETHQADLVGPTTIVYKEETTILSSNGWYNTESEESLLLDQSRVIHTNGRTLTGDTIFYDKLNGYGRVYGHMQSVDSANSMTLYANHGEIWEASNNGYATDSVLLVSWSDTAMYTYLHADTLYSQEIAYQTYRFSPSDSLLRDTLWADTSYMQLRAVHNVRVYREDMQSVCDSMRYNGKDSVLTLCGNPVCWNGSNQVSADTIKIYMKNGDIDYMYGIGNAIAAKQEDVDKFNQLAGKEMLAYFRDGDVYMIEVKGNAETVFYPQEEDGSFSGVNKTESSFVKMYLENRKIHHVVFTSASSGVMIPIGQATSSETTLGGFFWAEEERPVQPSDVFLTIPRTPRPNASVASASDTDENDSEK
jgi:lipopolysaccharide export system protein LptA